MTSCQSCPFDTLIISQLSSWSTRSSPNMDPHLPPVFPMGVQRAIQDAIGHLGEATMLGMVIDWARPKHCNSRFFGKWKLKTFSLKMNILLAHFKGFWQPHVTDTTHTIRFSHPLLYRKQNAKNMPRTEVWSLGCCTHTLPFARLWCTLCGRMLFLCSSR